MAGFPHKKVYHTHLEGFPSLRERYVYSPWSNLQRIHTAKCWNMLKYLSWDSTHISLDLGQMLAGLQCIHYSCKLVHSQVYILLITIEQIKGYSPPSVSSTDLNMKSSHDFPFNYMWSALLLFVVIMPFNIYSDPMWSQCEQKNIQLS